MEAELPPRPAIPPRPPIATPMDATALLAALETTPEPEPDPDPPLDEPEEDDTALPPDDPLPDDPEDVRAPAGIA